jgi:hypothetical protein
MIHDMIQSFGLAKVISNICEPGTFNEWDCPLVIAMYRRYCWRETLGMILHRWIPDNISEAFPKDVTDTPYFIFLILTYFILFFTVAKTDRAFPTCRCRVVYTLSQ